MSSSTAREKVKMGHHSRAPWSDEDPAFIRIHGLYQQLLGTHKRNSRDHPARRDRYERAKRAYDLEAAFDIVDEIFSNETVERIIDDVERLQKPPRILMPQPEWDSGEPDIEVLKPSNALPFAYAQRLGRELACDVGLEIIQIARPGRTKLKHFQRFIWQPRFEGPIRHDHAYILVDDVCHFGGTLAMLRSYIVENGGTVASVSALACNDGKDSQFPIADRTIEMLKLNLEEALDEIWRKEVGHDTECLTEAEGLFILQWSAKQPNRSRDALLQRVREEFAAAKAK